MNKIKALSIIDSIKTVKNINIVSDSIHRAAESDDDWSKYANSSAIYFLYEAKDGSDMITDKLDIIKNLPSNQVLDWSIGAERKYGDALRKLEGNEKCSKVIKDGCAEDELDNEDIDALIADEYEAIAAYDKALKECSCEHAKQQIMHIRAEEVEHVKELEELKAKREGSVKDMAFNKAAEYKPAHNVYHNDWTPEQLRERLIRADKAGQQTILEGLLSTLESDIKADLNNGSLDKQETKKHYQKYVDMLKKLSLPGYYQQSINWSLKRIGYLGLN